MGDDGAGQGCGRRRLLITFTYTSGKPRENDALTISGTPAWADKPIQQFALKGAKVKPAA